MTTLTATPHTAQLFLAHDLLKPSVVFCFGVEAGRSHELPVGAVFGWVFSPSQFCLGKEHWRYVRFRVKWCQFRGGLQRERGYATEAERELTPEEVTFFEAEWRVLQEAERGSQPIPA